MFSVIVKWETFTKHILSQWTRSVFSPSQVIAAVQPLASRRPVKIEGGLGSPICLVEAHLFSKCGYGPSAYSQRTTIAAIDKCQGHFQQQRQFRALVARIAAAACFSDAFNSVGRERIKRLASARSALGQFVRSSA
jgi:hypothetical protein